MFILLKKINRFFESKIGWFFVNGRKIEDWEKYIEKKYQSKK